jgi:hypothetical protein
MIKKIILRILSLFFWIYAITGLLTVIIVMATQNDFTFVHFILFFILIGAFGFLGRLTWRKSGRILRRNDILTNRQANNIPNGSKIVSVKVKTTRDVPSETLTDMKVHYNNMQIEGDLRILSDSVELLKSTKNIETFISRYELAQRTALTLEQAKTAGIRIPTKFSSSKQLLNLKYELVPQLLQNSFEQMEKAALKLKTTKGQLNRYKKFNDLLIENEFFLEDFDEYLEIKQRIESNIKSLRGTEVLES